MQEKSVKDAILKRAKCDLSLGGLKPEIVDVVIDKCWQAINGDVVYDVRVKWTRDDAILDYSPDDALYGVTVVGEDIEDIDGPEF